MNKDDKADIFPIVFYSVFILIFIVIITVLIVKRIELTSKEKNSYEYALISYPDDHTTIEGYVERFVYNRDIWYITIDGEEYVTHASNAIIIRKKDLNVEKEIKND